MTTNGDISFSDVVSADLYYEENGSFKNKARPVLVLKVTENQLICYQITTKYEKKSDYVKLQYYKVRDLSSAGLDRQSWIDVGTKRNIAVDIVNFRKKGALSSYDKSELISFVKTLRARRAAYQLNN